MKTLALWSSHSVYVPLFTLISSSKQSICAFFSADGEGIRDGFRDKMLPVINFGCSLYEMDSSDLITFYENLQKSKHDRPIITGTHVISTLYTRPKDPVAKQFIDANAVNIISHDFLKLFGLAPSEKSCLEVSCTMQCELMCHRIPVHQSVMHLRNFDRQHQLSVLSSSDWKHQQPSQTVTDSNHCTFQSFWC